MHVRTEEQTVRVLLQQGVAQSPTFAELLDSLSETDIIVYIESTVLQEGLSGFISHRVVVAGDHRYVRVVLNPFGRPERLLAVLAHELQHALEIGREPAVGRSETVADLYARIGYRSGCPELFCWETIEAIDVQRLVYDDLSRH